MENLFLIAALIVVGILIAVLTLSSKRKDKSKKKLESMTDKELNQEYYKLMGETDELNEKYEFLTDEIDVKDPECVRLNLDMHKDLLKYPQKIFNYHMSFKKQKQDVELQIAKNAYKKEMILSEQTIREKKEKIVKAILKKNHSILCWD